MEGILTLCIVYALTAIKGGGSFWQQSALETLGFTKYDFIPDSVYNLPFNQWYLVYGGIILAFNLVQRSVSPFFGPPTVPRLTIFSSTNVMNKRREEGKRARIALLGLLPYFGYWLLAVFYLYLQPIILHYHLIPFVFYVGLINAYSVGRIIVAHLTKNEDFPMVNVLILPLALAVLDSAGPILGLWPSVLGDGMYQVAFTFLMMGLAIGVYGSFIVSICTRSPLFTSIKLM